MAFYLRSGGWFQQNGGWFQQSGGWLYVKRWYSASIALLHLRYQSASQIWYSGLTKKLPSRIFCKRGAFIS